MDEVFFLWWVVEGAYMCLKIRLGENREIDTCMCCIVLTFNRVLAVSFRIDSDGGAIIMTRLGDR